MEKLLDTAKSIYFWVGVGCRNFDGVEWRFFEGPFKDELKAKEIAAVMLKTAKYS
ncbi:hypothetical protein [Arcticibacterium luteifluviistationis]|uniref:hypothetical protein n=1 Tax=Arcticibacterium luteifluviistationis TaxID=1784714 RepID=UPI0013A6E1C1|nr:hypothetical protein [Arcticibacterium luteifluviistationis]